MFYLIVALAAAGLAPAQTYDIRPAPDSRFALEVAKTGLLSGKKHLFLFDRYQGTLHFDAAAPEKSRVELSIESASIECKDNWVSAEDLKKVMAMAIGPEMLEVSKHPHIRFVSSSVAKSGEGYSVQGELTIKGVAKPVTVAVSMSPRGDGLVFKGKAEVKLRDYGLKPPGAAFGVVGTKNEMQVDFSVVGTRR
jgi:polyisoprenoid-binding protein YceI